jgi:hypothetical protein
LRFLVGAIAAVYVVLATASIVSGTGKTSASLIIDVCWVVACWLILALILRHSRAAGRAAEPPPAVEANYRTGLLVLARAKTEEQVSRYVADWTKRHPRDASVAVAKVAANGAVSVDLYSTSDGTRLWRGDVGTVPPDETAATALNPITTLISQFLGVEQMDAEVAS